jgi:sialic acid synthase SpsE
MGIKIIAELAQGFEGKPEQARLLMRAAANSGADAAKYQLVYADELATPDYKYYDLFKSLEMSDEVWKSLSNSAKELNIELQLDIFGLRSLKLAEKIGVKTIKLHGTDIANIGLLNDVAESTVNRILLGAGGALLGELQKALAILQNKEVIILLGFQGYPTPNDSNQIERVRILKQNLCSQTNKVKIGFADHSEPSSNLSIALPAMAIGAGAEYIEKHLTLGKIMMMEDHEAALNPDEFYEFSKTLRECSNALGLSQLNESFDMSEPEVGYRKMIRRHVVSSRDITAGSILNPSDVVLKRTSSEEILTDMNDVYNKELKKNISGNSAITKNDFF